MPGRVASASRTGQAVGDDGRAQVGGEMLGDLERRGAAVDRDHLPALDQLRRRPGDRGLGLGRLRRARRVRNAHRRLGQRKRAAVDAMKQSVRRQLAEVAADRVFRHVESPAELGRDHPSVPPGGLQNQPFSLRRQHSARSCTNMHDFILTLPIYTSYRSRDEPITKEQTPMTLDFPFKLAAVDLDDTLLGPDKKVGQANRDALERLRVAGLRRDPRLRPAARQHAAVLPRPRARRLRRLLPGRFGQARPDRPVRPPRAARPGVGGGGDRPWAPAPRDRDVLVESRRLRVGAFAVGAALRGRLRATRCRSSTTCRSVHAQAGREDHLGRRAAR